VGRLQTILGCILLLSASTAFGGNGNYFHVDDFAGLPAGFAPLAGNHSLWCGRRAGPGFVSDGYGNDWDECFESCEFGVTSDITFSYQIRWDLEPDYDFGYVEYLNAGNVWTRFAVGSSWGDRYTGTGTASESFVIPAASLGSTVRFRFSVISDGSYSDQDGLWLTTGAITVDNVTVKNGAVVVNYEDFECESPGDQETYSGKWGAGAHASCSTPRSCGPLITRPTTWGRVKALYH
jgi:hypothetical protein